MHRMESPLRMARAEMISAQDDWGIEVVSGCVWLTHAGCPKDWILERGDLAVMWKDRASIACALADSEIRLARLPRPAWAPFA